MFFVCGSFVQYSGVEVGPCCTRGFPRGSVVKNLPAMQETWVQSLGWEDPLDEGKGYPLQYSGLENSMDSSLWGCKELDTVEPLSLSNCFMVNLDSQQTKSFSSAFKIILALLAVGISI